jgi:inhibitor of KinA
VGQVAPPPPRFLSLGEQGLVVELGAAIDDAIADRVERLARRIGERLGHRVLEVVPTYRSLLVLHDPVDEPRADLIEAIAGLASEPDEAPAAVGRRVVRIPVCYGGAGGPDLEWVAAHTGLSVDEVVARHCAPAYRVHMLGFTPGFPYLGGMDPRLACPRLDAPRPRVVAGSVGIGGEQTGVYPVPSPGGWRILGRTPLRLFDPAAARPFLLRAGDRVRFAPIAPATFAELAERVADGVPPDVEEHGP